MKIHIYAWPLLAVLLVMDLGILAWALADHTVSGRGWQKYWRCLNGCLMLAALYGILRYTVLRKSGGHEAEFRFLRSWAEFMAQPELFREMVMNAFLFFPLGLTMPFAFRKRKRNAGITVLFAFLLSAAIEFCQYRYALGNGEVTDILMNTLGAGVGTAAFLIVNSE